MKNSLDWNLNKFMMLKTEETLTFPLTVLG